MNQVKELNIIYSPKVLSDYNTLIPTKADHPPVSYGNSSLAFLNHPWMHPYKIYFNFAYFWTLYN